MLQNLLTLFQPASPKLDHSALPFLEYVIKAIDRVLPHCLCLLINLVLPHVTLYDMVCPLFLGTLNNKLSFQWQSSPDLLASPHLNNNKTYIFKVPESVCTHVGKRKKLYCSNSVNKL